MGNPQPRITIPVANKSAGTHNPWTPRSLLPNHHPLHAARPPVFAVTAPPGPSQLSAAPGALVAVRSEA